MAAETKLNPFQRLKAFYEEIITEMQKVTWPTKEDLMVSTRVVCLVLAIVAAIIFGFDQVFAITVYVLLSVAA